MRFWFTPSTTVPLREQIVQQVRLGILSGELRPGERLPSTRQLARRYGMHFNTVSAAFQQLAAEGCVEVRHGSGMFVSQSNADKNATGSQRESLPDLLRRAVLLAHKAGLTLPEVTERLQQEWQAHTAARRMVLVEPDAALARIVQHEIATATGTHLPHLRMRPADFPARLPRALAGATAVVLPSKAAAARQALGDSVVTLAIQPVATTLAAHLPTGRDHLVAIASHWSPFLQIAQGMLIAAGFDADSLVLRDADAAGWQEGLTATSAVVCDSLTAAELPQSIQPLRFRLLQPSSLQALQVSPETPSL